MHQSRFRTLSFTLPTLATITLGVCSSLSAQVTTGSIVGHVTDATGAVIPGAMISITDLERGLSKTANTGNDGSYRVDFLLTGTYKVAISAPGFSTFVQTGITLDAGVPADVNAQLTPGAVSDVVEVTGQAPLVETTNGEIGTTVNQREIVSLPLVNRNAYTLLDLTPGVQLNSVTQSFGAPTQTSIINGGVRNGSGSTNYFLDGAPNLNALNAGAGLIPNPDALQEFRVQTSNYGAADGRFANGVVSALVRSGTNSVHGTIFEFLRNPHLNARPWGSVASAPKEPLHRNQFGATVGGPIRRDKTFFFGSYAGLRQTDAALQSGAIVPTALERTGNFTASLGTRPIDPLTGTNFVCNGVKDVICANRIDAVSNKLLNYVPASNATIATSAGPAPSWSGYSPAPITQDDFLLKVNHVINPANSAYVTYFMTAGNTSSLGSAAINPNALLAPYVTLLQTYRQQNSIVNETWVINPKTVNNVWLSYIRMHNNRTDLPGTSLADLGSTFTPQGPPSLPNVTVTGFFQLPDANAGPAATDTYSARDLVSLTLGKHTMQFGGEFLLDRASKAAYLNNYGLATFSGAVTKNALADFLLGTPATLEQDSPAYTRTSEFTYAGFFQDDYRITPRLTLNLGLRYDVQTPPVEAHDHNTTFIAGQQSTRFPNAPLGTVFPGDAGVPRGINSVSFAHVSPRFGFALDAFGNQKTSLRGGIGLYWGSVSEELWTQGGNTSPFALAYTFPNVSSINGATLSNPYHGGSNPFPNTGTTFPFGTRLSGIARDAQYPETVQANLSVQQQLTNDLVVTIAYVGSFGMNQGLGIDNNYPTLNTNYAASLGTAQCGTAATIIPTTSNSQCRRPVQPLGSFSLAKTIFHTDYNGLQVSVTQRLSHHVSASGYYAWSKSLSDVPLEAGVPAGGIQDVNNLAAERGRTINDLTHQAVFAIIYQPTFGFSNRFARAIVNGFEITPLVRLHSGAPFSIANGIDANLDGATGDRPNLIGNPRATPHTLTKWFNTAAFQQNSAVAGRPVDGNSSVTLLDAPAFHSLDLTLARTLKIHDQFNLQLRAEATNALNIASYLAPGATVNSATFGVVTGANTVRQIQVGAKLTF